MDTYKKELEFSTVSPVPKLERLKEYIACYGEVTCDGLPKQVKYHLESILFTVEQLDLAAGCIDKNGLRREMDQCIYFIPDSRNPDDIFACAEKLAEEGECNAEETIAIMTAALVQKDFGKEMEQVMEGKKQFDVTFDPAKYQY
uniref:DUF4240 domain-containing protein n=1 Tax=Caenorhabditis tropicalis TaxID=1561998 RepID=A0A1I7V2J8_9PELO